jgi:hypothetical protein
MATFVLVVVEVLRARAFLLIDYMPHRAANNLSKELADDSLYLVAAGMEC